jgi:ferritin
MAHITKRLQEAFIHQGKFELEGYLYYLSGSNWFNIRHLSGIAGYLKVISIQKEADSEKQHFEDIVQYLTLRQTQLIIPQPTLKTHEWSTELDAFKTFHNVEMQNFSNLYLRKS